MPSSVRIIGGQWRSRRIDFPDLPELRPTQDRIRETLFNWLSPYIVGARCLDLFAGSGALGFEALSRGASFCCFVDSHPQVIAALRASAEKLAVGGEQVEIIKANCPRAMPQLPGAPFNIIFLDPPFQQQLLSPVMDWLNQSTCLDAEALIYVEREKAEDIVFPQNWRIYRQQSTPRLRYELIKYYKTSRHCEEH